MPASVFSQIGGHATLERVHKDFYDKVYEHRWLGKFFAKIDQKHIEDQQTKFMAGAMGGPKQFAGRLPSVAHIHMYITQELFDLRHEMLAVSIREAGVPEAPAKRWLQIDAAFRGHMCKASPGECKKRFFTDELMMFER